MEVVKPELEENVLKVVKDELNKKGFNEDYLDNFSFIMNQQNQAADDLVIEFSSDEKRSIVS